MRFRPVIIVRLPTVFLAAVPLAVFMVVASVVLALCAPARAQGTVRDYLRNEGARNGTVSLCRNNQWEARNNPACLNSSHANMLAVEREIMAILGEKPRPQPRPRQKDRRS